MWIFVKKFDFLKKISGKIEHLDPDPYSEYGSGSRVSSPTNTDPFRIRLRIRNPGRDAGPLL